MKSRMLTISGIVAVAALTGTLIWGRTTTSKRAQSNKPAQQATFLVAAAGRVEPGSEDIKLSSELNGKLKSIRVEEGDHVTRGPARFDVISIAVGLPSRVPIFDCKLNCKINVQDYRR